MKPLMRGYIHQAAFIFALAACGSLISQSHNNSELFANSIYSLSLIGLYGISALYHIPMWNRRSYMLIRRIDHAAIFGLIAGSATPICLIGIKGQTGKELMILVWVVAFFGMIIAIFWPRAPKWVRAVLYISAGWLALPYLPDIKSALGETDFWLLVAGGVTYSLGAIIYACKKPNLVPHIFGYHELFHVLVVIASVFHFAIIYGLTH